LVFTLKFREVILPHPVLRAVPYMLFFYILLVLAAYIIKGKANPLQAWTGPEGSRRLRLPDFKTIGT